MPKLTLFAIVMGMVFCPAVLPGPARGANDTPATLEVIGRADVTVQPDIALVAFAVETNAREAARATAENARKTEALLKVLRPIMGSNDKLQTTGYNLQPVYDKNDRRRPSGYRASNRVALKTVQLEKIGDFIDQGAASGAAQISRLQFSTARLSEHRTQAAVLAVDKARSNAEKLARAAGVALKRVMRIRYAPPAPPGVFRERAALAMGPTPIEIGDLTIEAEVTMVFEIE